MLNVLAGILKGYGGTMLDLQGKDAQQEIERRRARLQIIAQAIPNITDPSLHAEAVALAEELAAGKGKKKGGLAGFLSALTGGQAGDIGQGEKLKEFMGRPREAMVRPPATVPGPGLPSIPGLLPGEPTQTTIPGVSEQVRGPFPTPTEQIQQRAALTEAEARVQADVKGDVAAREAKRLADEARGLGLMNPADIANYVRGHMVIPTATTAVAGTVPGAALAGQLATDALGNPIDPKQDYRVTRRPDGTVASAYPAAEATHIVAGDFTPDIDSTTGVSRFLRDSRTGKNVGVQRNVLPPSGWAPSVSTTQSIRLVQQADGTIVAVPVTSTTTRERQFPTGAPQGAGAGAPPTGTRPRAALPPVPGMPPSTQPQEIVGEKPRPEPVVKTSDGRTVVGHKAMTVSDRRDIGSIALSLYVAEVLNKALDQPDPGDTRRRLRDREGTLEQLSDAVKARWGTLRYGKAGMTSGSSFLKSTMALSNLAGVIMVSPYLKGIRAHTWVENIQKHIPDASWQSPAGMAERVEMLVPILRNMQADMQAELGLSNQQMAEFMRQAAKDTGINISAAAQPEVKPEEPPVPKWSEGLTKPPVR